jgi:hypothetical protein
MKTMLAPTLVANDAPITNAKTIPMLDSSVGGAMLNQFR